MARAWTASAYRAWLSARHREAAAARIAEAREAVQQLAVSEPVDWADIQAVHERDAPRLLRAALSYTWQAVGLAISAFVLYRAGTLYSLKGKHGPVIPRAEEHAVLTGAAVIAGIVFLAIWLASWLIKHDKVTRGRPPRQADEVVSAALDLLPRLASLSTSGAGRARHEAMEKVLDAVSALKTRIRYSSGKSGGLRHYYGSQIKLMRHGRRVNAVLTVQTTRLIESRDEAIRELARLAVQIASAQARCDYGALLPERDLARGVGPDALEGRVAIRVFGPATGVAAVVLVLTLVLGGTGSTLLFVPILVFVVSAVITATMTGNLDRIRPFMAFIRDNGVGAEALTDDLGAAGAADRDNGNAHPGTRPHVPAPRAAAGQNASGPSA
ncbi:hypothetical protein ACFWIB_03565 [Streptomyces sp. NPDC127051]|uniref:hypothetical protein n=1 Tax=Streptomyces sp. NPDC127051 TaxID=3347119 RepID=UPI003663CCA5